MTGWLTPAQLAAEIDKPVRWVIEHMRSGDIPSIKIGRQRWFTPECRERMMAAQLTGDASPANQWGRATRGRR